MSRLDESSYAMPKTWADLIDTEIYTKSKKSFVLLRVIGQKNISKKKLVEYFQDKGVEIPPVIIDIKDGMLVSFQSGEEAWPFQSRLSLIQVDDVKLRVFPKDVPPLHENAFIVKVGDCDESDLKKYFKQFHQKNQPQPVIQSLPQKDCFSVAYKSEAADVSKIKRSLKKIPCNGTFLTIKPFCRTDCIRVTKLKDDATDDEIREGCMKHGHYRVTHIEKATKKSAFVYFANYEDAEDLIKKTSATNKIKVGAFYPTVSLYYHPETIIATPEATSTSTRRSSKKTLATQFSSQPSTPAVTKSSTSSANAGRSKDCRRASSGSSSAADLVLVPCVPHGVLEFVVQLPEPNDELKKEFEREGNVSFVPKQIFSVKGDSFHYVVHLKLSESSQNAANGSGSDEQKFEAKMLKRLDRFFERFSSESEEFDTYRLKLLRSEFDWDRDSDLLAIALDDNNMVQVHIRWNDMKEGNVTVSGYKSQVGRVLKKLKKAVAKQETPCYSGGQQRQRQNPLQREPSVVEHSLNLFSSDIRNLEALCQKYDERKMISAVQCEPSENYNRFTVKGRPRAVAKATQFSFRSGTPAVTKSSTSSGDAGRSKDCRRASSGSSSAADLVLVPCVPHGVLEFVVQLPEPNDELKKEFEREGNVSFVPKQIFSVKGDSFHYVVHLKLSEFGQNAANDSGSEGQKFEAEMLKRLDRFFEQFSSKSEEFDTYRLKLLRSEFDWDRDSDLLAIALDANDMVVFHVRWNDMKEGNVTVSGYKSQVGRVLKKLKEAVAMQESPRYSGGQQRKWKSHQEREPSFVVEHSLDLCRPVIRHVDALCQASDEWKVMSSAVQCTPNESYTSFKVKGRPNAVAEAMQWLEAESMKLVTTRHDVDDPSLSEFLRGEEIENIVSEVEQETKCFIEIETTEPSDEWSGNKMLEPRQSLKHLSSLASSRSGQIGSIHVIVKQGDITKENVDVIINPTGISYDVTASQVGKALVAKGGRSIIDDCRAKRPSSWSLITPDFIVTTGGRLACQKIIHMSIEFPDRPEKLFPKLEKIFSEGEKLRMRSIALPAIGTGTLCLDARKCARMTHTAIKNIAKKSLKHLREIRVVLFDQTLLKTFQEEILKSSRVAQSSLSALERPPWPTELEAQPHSSSIDRVRKPNDVERGMMTVVLCSTHERRNQEAWDSLLQRVCECVAGEEVNETLKISLLQFLDHRRELFNLDQEFHIRVEILFTKYQSKCVIYGAKDDVSRACSKARILLQMETPIDDWQKRWRELKTPEMRIESIVNDREKCENILSKFTARGGFLFDVKEVEKIMNPSLYQRFEQRKSEIRQLVEKPNRFFFYGVPSQLAYDVICTYGWNVVANDADGNQRRLAPSQFFTTSKQALHDAKPDSQGLKRIILADVIVGNHCQSFGSSAEMKELCENAGNHSVTNKRDNPTAFTLYSEHCAYPLYVVTFTS